MDTNHNSEKNLNESNEKISIDNNSSQNNRSDTSQDDTITDDSLENASKPASEMSLLHVPTPIEYGTLSVIANQNDSDIVHTETIIPSLSSQTDVIAIHLPTISTNQPNVTQNMQHYVNNIELVSLEQKNTLSEVQVPTVIRNSFLGIRTPDNIYLSADEYQRMRNNGQTSIIGTFTNPITINRSENRIGSRSRARSRSRSRSRSISRSRSRSRSRSISQSNPRERSRSRSSPGQMQIYNENETPEQKINTTKIFLKDAPPRFTIENKPRKDYVGMCDTLHNIMEQMKNENKEPDKRYDECIESVTAIKNKLSRLITIGNNANKRDIMIASFCRTAHEIIGVIPYTKGSYDRKRAEMISGLSDLFDDDVYGNPIGSEITFIFKAALAHIGGYMEALRNTTDRPIEKRIVFGNYRLDRVRRSNLHDVVKKLNNAMPVQMAYEIIMTDIDTNVSIMCNVAKNTAEEEMKFGVEGITQRTNDIINQQLDLIGRRAGSKKNYVKRVAKLSRIMPRKKRARIWNDILKFIDSELSLLDEGYHYVDAGDNFTFNTEIEDKEQCPITCIDPPYIKIYMSCGHCISLQCVNGLINDGESEDTEAIKCPLCRETLIPVMIPAISVETKKKFEIKTYTLDDFGKIDDEDHGIVMEKNTSSVKEDIPRLTQQISQSMTADPTDVVIENTIIQPFIRHNNRNPTAPISQYLENILQFELIRNNETIS